MPKRPGKPEPNLTPFSIASQVTGPPFAHSLDHAELRKKLMLEMAQRSGPKSGKAGAADADKAGRREGGGKHK